jgi:SAM-dependent methyltransferase
LVPDADAAPITFVEGSTYEIPFPDGAFDFVYARLLCQHLEQPDRAMGEIARVLAPGGSVMLVDSDDGVLSMTPEPEGFAELNRLAIELQRTRGGDREVGRKLGGLCRKAGLHGIEIKVQVFTTEQIPIEQFIAIALSFKVELFNIEDRPRAQSLLDSILAHVDARTFAMGGIYLVSAKRGR